MGTIAATARVVFLDAFDVAQQDTTPEKRDAKTKRNVSTVAGNTTQNRRNANFTTITAR